MAGRGSGPDFVESLARGLDVLRAFDAAPPCDVAGGRRDRDRAGAAHRTSAAADAGGAGLRPLRRRRLLADAEGASRSARRTSRPSDSGTSPARTSRRWSARPASRPRWRSSTAATSSTSPASRCRRSSPCASTSARSSRRRQTSQGKVLLAALSSDGARRGARDPVAIGPALPAASRVGRDARATLDEELTQVRARGWALADEELAPGVRSIAVPVRDGTGTVRAAMNVTVHAAETTTETLLDAAPAQAPPRRRRRLADWAAWQSRPHHEATPMIEEAR